MESNRGRCVDWVLWIVVTAALAGMRGLNGRVCLLMTSVRSTWQVLDGANLTDVRTVAVLVPILEPI